MALRPDGEGLLVEEEGAKTRGSDSTVPDKSRKAAEMRVTKKGLFYRIVVGGLISKKRFWRRQSAFKYYYAHQDRDGFPVKEIK